MAQSYENPLRSLGILAVGLSVVPASVTVMSTVLEHPPADPVNAAVADAAAAVTAGLGEPVWTLGDRQLTEAVDATLAVVASAQALLAGLVGEVDARGTATATGAPTTVSWLRHHHNLAPVEAAKLVHTATALRTGLPATNAALGAGTISLAHAHGIARACADLPEDLDPDLAASAEARMVTDATNFDPVIAARLARYVVTRNDPDGADARDGKKLADDETKAAAANQLSLTPDRADYFGGPGGYHLHGHLDPEAHAILDTALQPLMCPRGETPDGPDLRSAAARRADALVELCRRALAGGDLPSVGGIKPSVVVTTQYQTLTESLGVALLPDGTALSPAAARHWACDANIIAAVLDAASAPLDIAEPVRLFTGRLRRALELRDGGCTHPGCDRPAAWCEGHHIKPWAAGGTTSLANGVLLCRFHHRLVEHGHWQVWIHTDGLPIWRPPPWVDPDQTLLRNHTHRPHQPHI